VPLQRGGSNWGDKNYSSSFLAYSIEGPKVSNESCLTWITTRKYEMLTCWLIISRVIFLRNQCTSGTRILSVKQNLIIMNVVSSNFSFFVLHLHFQSKDSNTWNPIIN
jgi:hypothetical protein